MDSNQSSQPAFPKPPPPLLPGDFANPIGGGRPSRPVQNTPTLAKSCPHCPTATRVTLPTTQQAPAPRAYQHTPQPSANLQAIATYFPPTARPATGVRAQPTPRMVASDPVRPSTCLCHAASCTFHHSGSICHLSALHTLCGTTSNSTANISTTATSTAHISPAATPTQQPAAAFLQPPTNPQIYDATERPLPLHQQDYDVNNNPCRATDP